jgi:hypothetical protein
VVPVPVKKFNIFNFVKILKDAALFVYFHIFNNIHTFIQSQYIHPSPFAEASLHFLIACVLSGENFPVVPSRELNFIFESGIGDGKIKSDPG